MGQDRQHTEHGNERKQQLLEAAQRMFGSRGYARTRIADICAEAGVAKGLFYWYFPTKESLFVELVHSMRLQLRRAQATAMHDGADPITRIRQGTEASIRFILENQSYFAFLDLQRADPAIASVLEEGSDVYERDIERLIVEAQREGVMPDVDAHFAAVGVVGAVSSFGYATRHGRLTMQEDQLAHLVGDWVMQALTAPTVLPDLGRAGSSR
jgi:AcrR family transcriptional regulator